MTSSVDVARDWFDGVVLGASCSQLLASTAVGIDGTESGSSGWAFSQSRRVTSVEPKKTEIKTKNTVRLVDARGGFMGYHIGPLAAPMSITDDVHVHNLQPMMRHPERLAEGSLEAIQSTLDFRCGT